MDGGAGWRATDGVKDVKRVWENALHAVFHRTDLDKEKKDFKCASEINTGGWFESLLEDISKSRQDFTP